MEIEFIPFPCELLPAPLAAHVTEAAAAIGCDPAQVACHVLAVIAGVIGSTRRVTVKQGWTEPAILWTAVSLPTGSQKGPALDAALDPLREIQGKMLADWKQEVEAARALRKKEKESNGGDDSLPAPRILANDATAPAIAKILSENPRGVLFAQDELAIWLGSFGGQHKSSAGERAKWIELYGGRPTTIDRITRGEVVSLLTPAISITGGIQPKVYQKLMDADDVAAGLDARLMITEPPARDRIWTDAEMNPTTMANYREVLEKLLTLRHVDEKPVTIGMSRTAKNRYIQFFNENGQRLGREKRDVLRGVLAKMEANAARMALAFHLVKLVYNVPMFDPDEPDQVGIQDDRSSIGESTMESAIGVTEWFIGERERILKSKPGRESDDGESLEKYIVRKGGKMSARDLQHNRKTKFRTMEAATEALEEMVRNDRGKWEEVPSGPKGGKPTRVLALSAATIRQYDETPEIVEEF